MRTGWWPSWEAVAAEAGDYLELHRSLEHGWRTARGKIAQRRRTSRAGLAVDVLAATPLLSATTLARAIGMSVKCATELLDRFVAEEVAVEVTHRSARRLFGLVGLAPTPSRCACARSPGPQSRSGAAPALRLSRIRRPPWRRPGRPSCSPSGQPWTTAPSKRPWLTSTPLSGVLGFRLMPWRRMASAGRRRRLTRPSRSTCYVRSGDTASHGRLAGTTLRLAAILASADRNACPVGRRISSAIASTGSSAG